MADGKLVTGQTITAIPCAAARRDNRRLSAHGRQLTAKDQLSCRR